jgi:hypothetical protein
MPEPKFDEACPLTSILPAMVTFPVASMYTGVLLAFLAKETVTPKGMLIVVKLNMPLAGICKTVSMVGASEPSLPLLPLLNWACVGRVKNVLTSAHAKPMNFLVCVMMILLISTPLLSGTCKFAMT